MSGIRHSGVLDFVSGIADSVMTTIRDAAARRHAMRELAAYADEEGIAHVCSDLGLNRNELTRAVASQGRSPRLLKAMTERIGLDLDHVADPLTRHDIERNCSVCGQQRRCERWLKSGAISGIEEFCPNAGAFRDLLPPGALPERGSDEWRSEAAVRADEVLRHEHEARVVSQLPFI